MVKETLELEDYLNSENEKGRRLFARIRSGTSLLRIEHGRGKGIPRSERKCWFGCGQVEDEYHFLMSCPIYDDLRQDIISLVGAAEFQVIGFTVMMGNCSRDRVELVIKYVQCAAARRKRILAQRY